MTKKITHKKVLKKKPVPANANTAKETPKETPVASRIPTEPPANHPNAMGEIDHKSKFNDADYLMSILFCGVLVFCGALLYLVMHK